jgi:membrane protein
MFLKEAWAVLKQTGQEWVEDNAARLGAALAFYSVLSLAPLLVIVIAIAAAVFGEEAARGEVVAQIEGMVGREGAQAIQDMIAHAQKPAAGTVATVLGVAVLLFGASGVFGQLQDALNTIWEVRPKSGRGVWGVVKDRFFSFAMVLGTGFLLLVSLTVSAVLHALGEYLAGLMPGLESVWLVVNFLISFGVITLLFALIFKLVPDVKIAWKDVWVGAVLTALLFTAGKFLLGLYLGRGSVSSAYGAAGSLVVLVVWIYYSAQILFFGAEFTQVYAKRYGSQITPSENAEPVTEEARAQQGMTRGEGVGAQRG